MTTPEDNKQQTRQDNRQGTGMAHPAHPSPSGTGVGDTMQPTSSDSHQRQMEMHSEVWGLLEDSVGERQPHTETSVHPAAQDEPPVHQSNDVTGGLPRSPGGTGPHSSAPPLASDEPPVHQSNDVAGGLPRSPGGANRLAGDRKMDDDTGFSRK